MLYFNKTLYRVQIRVQLLKNIFKMHKMKYIYRFQFKIIFFLMFFISNAFSQTNIKAEMRKQNPVDKNSTLNDFEKINVHKQFLSKAIIEKNITNQFYGYLYLFVDYYFTNDYVKMNKCLLDAEVIANKTNNVSWKGIINMRKAMAFGIKEDRETALYQRSNTPFFLGSFGSKLIPDFAPPIAGPETENLTSIVLANDRTSFISNPFLILVPPPAAPPLNELITVQPSASVSGSFQLKTISGSLFSNFCNKSFINSCKLCSTNIHILNDYIKQT